MQNFLTSYYKERINIKKLEKFKFVLLECNICKTIFQEQIPDSNFSFELYEEIIDKDESLAKKEDFEKKNIIKLDYEIGLIKGLFKKNNEEIKIMEFGAGWGFWLNYLKKNNFNVSAFEVSKARIDFMKNKKINVISDLLSVEENFDFIFSEQTFEHISNPRDTLFNLSKILKYDGYIFLRFPSSFLFNLKLNKSYKPKNDCVHPLEHINLFRKESFEAMTSNSNLQIINFRSRYNFSIINALKDIKNFFYFDSILIKKTNK